MSVSDHQREQCGELQMSVAKTLPVHTTNSNIWLAAKSAGDEKGFGSSHAD
jgi:hypothetical protein